MAAGFVILAANPAAAISSDLPDWMPDNPFECPPGVSPSKVPPTPAMPKSGMLGGLVEHDPNVTGDPFAPDAQVSILDQYGYAGLEWHTYDLGCGGDIINPTAAFTTAFTNWMMFVPTAMLQAVGFVGSSFGDAEWVKAFDGIFGSLAHAILERPFPVLFVIASAALGALLVAKARKQATADAMSDATWWFGLGVGAVVLLTIPVYLIGQIDNAFDYGMDAVRESFGPGAGPLANVGPTHHDTLYVAWCSGTLGSAESPVAQQYCPELFKAQAFSYQELRDIATKADPAGEYRQAVQGKQKRWMEVAEAVKRDYPDAYVTLQGKDGGTRFAAAAGATLDVAALSLFLLWAGLAFVVARFTIRVVIILAPLAAVIGVFPKQRHRMFDLWNTLTAALVRAVVALFAAGLVSVLIGAVRTAPGTSQVTRLLASALISWAAWKCSKPFRKMGMLETGAWRTAKTVGLTALGTKIGVDASKAAGMPWRPGPPETPTPPPPRTGYDAGHARSRGSESGGTYRPAPVPPLLRSGMSAIDAVPTSVDGETVYQAKQRSGTSHRSVNHEPHYPDARVRSAAPPTGPRSKHRPDASATTWYDTPGAKK